MCSLSQANVSQQKKAKLFLCMPLNVYGVALVGGEWLASHPDCFTPGGKTPGIHIQEEQKTSTTCQQKPELLHSTPPQVPHIINSIQTTEHQKHCLILGKNGMHMHTVLLQRQHYILHRTISKNMFFTSITQL